jgi:hypothetical protein
MVEFSKPQARTFVSELLQSKEENFPGAAALKIGDGVLFLPSPSANGE